MAPTAEDFNKDELEPPKWLNVEFFNEVLQHHKKDPELQVKNVRMSPATCKGDHYASVMFRATIDFVHKGDEQRQSLIIKTMPELDGHKKELVNSSYVFETEIGMYTEVLPKFERILAEVGLETVLRAPCVYYALSPRKLIIFEDIVPRGYEVLRSRPVNFEEVKASFAKIAKWHAVSIKLANEDPTYFDQYRHSFLTMPNVLEQEFLKRGLGDLIDVLDSVPDLVKYKPYFEALGPNYLQDVQEAFTEFRRDPQPNAPYVLCHGDFHAKNMMFKHNAVTGDLEDIMLLDFQLSYMGPMANDIIYATFMLMDSDMRANHKDELIYYYFNTVQKTLDKLNYEGPRPKLVDFRAQLLRQKKFELFMIYTFLPLWYAFLSGDVEPAEAFESNDVRSRTFRNPTFVDELRKLLPYYLHLGYFEN